MGNCILMEITSAVIWAYFIGGLSRQSLAVSGFAQLIKNEGKSVMIFFQKVTLSKFTAGIIRKPSRALGWRGYLIKKAGILTKSVRDNIIRQTAPEKWRKPALSEGCANE